MQCNRHLALLLVLITALIQACSSKPIIDKPSVVDAGSGKDAAAGAPNAKVDPMAQAEFQKALAAMDQGREDEAIRMFEALAEKYPQMSGSQTNLGLLYLKRNDLDRAEAALQKAVSINDRNAVALTHLGIVYRKRGRFQDAAEAYEKALSSQPDYDIAHLNLGILYDIYLRKWDESLKHYEKYQSLQSSQDELVHKWIVDLENRIKSAKR